MTSILLLSNVQVIFSSRSQDEEERERERAAALSPISVFDYPYLIRGSSTPYRRSATKLAKMAVIAIIMKIA